MSHYCIPRDPVAGLDPVRGIARHSPRTEPLVLHHWHRHFFLMPLNLFPRVSERRTPFQYNLPCPCLLGVSCQLDYPFVWREWPVIPAHYFRRCRVRKSILSDCCHCSFVVGAGVRVRMVFSCLFEPNFPFFFPHLAGWLWDSLAPTTTGSNYSRSNFNRSPTINFNFL